MNDEQTSVTAAYTFVALSIVAKRGWVSTVGNWIRKGQTTPSPSSSGGIQDWQGALGSYALLLLMAENDSLGPFASALAWAVAFTLSLQLVENFKGLKFTSGAKQVGPIDTRPGSAITNPPEIPI